MYGPSDLWVNVTSAEPVEEPLPPRCSDPLGRAVEQPEERTAPDERESFLVVLLRALSAWHA